MSSSQGNRDSAPSIALDVLFASVLIALVLGGARSSYELGSGEPGTATMLTGLFMQSWGVLLLLSYAFPEGSYLLRGLVWVCEHGRWPRGRSAAVLFGILLLALGSVALLEGLGWIRI